MTLEKDELDAAGVHQEQSLTTQTHSDTRTSLSCRDRQCPPDSHDYLCTRTAIPTHGLNVEVSDVRGQTTARRSKPGKATAFNPSIMTRKDSMTNERQLDLFADYNPEPPCQAHSPTSRSRRIDRAAGRDAQPASAEVFSAVGWGN
jgi:hypothetical protein